MSHVSEHQPANTDEQYQEVKRRVFERWGIEPDGNVCVDDTATNESSFEELVCAVEEKTGVSREQVQAYVESVRSEMVAKFQKARAQLEPKLNELDQTARAAAADVSEQAKARYGEAESKVREKPMTALAIAFGVGIAAGLALGAGRRA